MAKTLEDIQHKAIIRIERDLGRSLHEPEVDFVKRYVEMFITNLDDYIAKLLAGRLED